MIKCALIPCGGFGTRCLPATKTVPKELMPVGDRPILQHIIKEAADAGIREIVIVTNQHKSAIQAHFGSSLKLEAHLESRGDVSSLSLIKDVVPSGCSLRYCFQEDALGLGDAILCARDFFENEDSFCVLLPDMYFSTGSASLSRMIDAYSQTGSNMLGVHLVDAKLVSNYGIIAGVSPLPHDLKPGNIFPIGKIVEKPAISASPSRYAISGRYILNRAIFDYLSDLSLRRVGELQITDAISLMLKDYDFRGFVVDGLIYDCGTLSGMLAANMDWLSSNEDLRNEISSLYNMKILSCALKKE